MIKVLCIEGDCAYEEDLDVDTFSAEACLTHHINGREDAEDWSILEDENIAGMHYVQIGEDVEGDTFKFIYNPNQE